jgi:diaminopimelate epimerase
VKHNLKQVFYKYQGTGNDFVMIDNRLETFPEDRTVVAFMQQTFWDRRWSHFIRNDPESDFKMV